MPSFASALCLGVALLAGFLLCRALACANLPALLGASAWAFSDPLLRPEVLAEAGSRGWPGPSLLLPFAVAGAFARSRARWPFLGLALVCFVERCRFWPGATPAAFGALDALVLAVLAALGAQRLWDGEGGPAFLLGAAAVVMAGAHEALRGEETRIASIELALAGAALVLVAVISRQRRARSGLVALLVLLGSERALELGLESRQSPDPARRALATAAAATPTGR